MEVRQQIIGEGSMTHIGQGGFWIRSSPSPIAVTRPKQVLREIIIDKENIPPAWAVTPQGRARPNKNKSPLPEWYLRTPLHDITVIVNAMERKSIRARAARIQHQVHEPEATHESRLLMSSESGEMSESDQTPPNRALSSETSPTPLDRFDASPSPLSSIGQLLEILPDDLLPSEQPSKPAIAYADSDMKVLQSDEYEKKLGSSIDEIEKVVLHNLNNTPKTAIAIADLDLKVLRSDEYEKNLRSSIDEIEKVMLHNRNITPKTAIAYTDLDLKVLRSDEYEKNLGSSIDEIEKVLLHNRDNTPKTAIAYADSDLKVLRSNEYEKNLGSSIDEIEKVVFHNLNNTSRTRVKKTTCNLLSMR